MEEKKKKARAVLSFKSGPHAGSAVRLKKTGTLLGREKGDIIFETDAQISATHCQIQLVKDAYVIFDMNSYNGTFVNGERVERRELKTGDLISIGKTAILFTLEEAEAALALSTQLAKSQITERKVVHSFIERGLESQTKVEVLIVLSYRDGSEEECTVAKDEFFLGRTTAFGRFADDPAISRRHLLVKVNSRGEIFIEDQDSTNGTFLNEHRVSGIHLVKSTDTVRIGGCSLKLKASISA